MTGDDWPEMRGQVMEGLHVCDDEECGLQAVTYTVDPTKGLK